MISFIESLIIVLTWRGKFSRNGIDDSIVLYFLYIYIFRLLTCTTLLGSFGNLSLSGIWILMDVNLSFNVDFVR